MKYLFASFFSLSLLGVADAQVYKLTEQTWENPEFRARFTQSYLADGETNPKITPEEKTLFDEIIPLIQSAPSQAIARLNTGITPESSAAFDFILGNLLYQEGKVADSIKAYQAAIRKFPNYFRAYYNAGRAFVADANYGDGLSYLQKAIEIQPGDGALYGLIGYCYINMDKPSTALDAYRIAIMLAPKSRDWRLGKLQSHIALDHTEDAIGMLYEFINEEPENADWWKLQANQFISDNDVVRAAANLSVVKDMGKADGHALTLLGDLLLNEGLVKPALESYLQGLDSKSVRPRRILEVVNSLIQLDEISDATKLVKKIDSTIASQLDEGLQLEMLNVKARLAMADDDVEGAAGYLGDVVAKDPLNGNALLTLADLERSRGDMAKAELYAESASKLDSFAHRASLLLAQLKVAQRDYKEAAKHLRRAQQISPKEYVADYLLRIEQAALRM